MSKLAQYKRHVGYLVDGMTRADPAARTPPSVAAGMVPAGKRTKGARAALFAALVTGALIERGYLDLAERLTVELAALDNFAETTRSPWAVVRRVLAALALMRQAAMGATVHYGN